MIVLRPEQGPELQASLLDELRSRNRRLPDFKRVSGYVVWDEDFPRTASLKVKRGVLAERIASQLDRDTAFKEL
jgi:acyl-coenzyme A synthetase/AMP-(fatty) acid ligase